MQLLELPGGSAARDNAAMPTEPSQTEPPKRKRRRFQFRLRTLLIGVTVVGVWTPPLMKAADAIHNARGAARCKLCLNRVSFPWGRDSSSHQSRHHSQQQDLKRLPDASLHAPPLNRPKLIRPNALSDHGISTTLPKS